MKGFDLSAILFNPIYAHLLLDGLKMTFIVAIGSWVLAMTLAIGLVIVRLGSSRFADRAVAAYVAYHSNVPTLVQLMLWYFGIASILPTVVQDWLNDHNAEMIFAIVSLGLCQAAFFCEDLRSGLRAVPAGQAEAARALGHSYLGAMRDVLLPQALRNSLPALINHTVSLFKNSSLAMAIGVAELTGTVKEIESTSFRPFETYLIATVLYLLCSLLLMAGGALLNRRLNLAWER